MLESKAFELATQLASEFLRNGSFDAFRAPMDASTVEQIVPASTGSTPIRTSEYGFSGLSVQSVGYTHGADDEAVYVYVTRGGKRQLDKLSAEVDGTMVNVVNLGKLVVRPEAASAAGIHGNVYEHNGRIACGSSCAPAGEAYSGTFGALVDLRGQMMALSNNHVFAACNHIVVGQPILSPSSMDSRPGVPAPRQICQHAQIIELRTGTPTLVPLARADAAVATVPDDSMVSSWQGDDVDGFDTPTSTMTPFAGMNVEKVGRTTGLTYGTIESLIPTAMALPYKTRHFTSTVWFTDVWTVRVDPASDWFALPGDSGSLVITEDGQNAVGLLFAAAGRGEYGVIAPIDTVLSTLGVSMIGGHYA